MRTIKNWAAGCLLGLGLVMAGCNGGDDEGGTTAPDGDLVGKWYIERSVSKGYIRALDADGEQLIHFPIDKDTTYSGNEFFVEFKSDNTYAASYPEGGFGFLARRAASQAALETGTWSVSGDIVTTVSAGQDTVKVKADIDGSSATFTIALDEVEEDPETGGVIESDIESTYHASK